MSATDPREISWLCFKVVTTGLHSMALGMTTMACVGAVFSLQDLSYNNLTGPLPYLETSLRRVFLSGNRLTGSITGTLQRH